MLKGFDFSQKSGQQVGDDCVRLVLQAGIELGDHQLKLHDQGRGELLFKLKRQNISSFQQTGIDSLANFVQAWEQTRDFLNLLMPFL
jgi:hypothetical protein